MKITEGVQYNLTALSFLSRNPRLWVYCIIPFILSIILMVGTIYLVYVFFGYLSIDGEDVSEVKITGVISFFKFIWIWLVGLLGVWLKWILFTVAVLILIWYGFGIVASIVMLPFLEILSCRVEEQLRGKSSPDNAWYVGLFSSLIFSLLFTVLKIIFMILFLIVGLFFPPVIILSFVITSWFCSMEALDLSMSRRLFSFKDKVNFFKGRHKMMVGVGSLSSLLLMVPLVQVFQPILSAVAGTMFWVDQTPEYGIPPEEAVNNSKDIN